MEMPRVENSMAEIALNHVTFYSYSALLKVDLLEARFEK